MTSADWLLAGVLVATAPGIIMLLLLGLRARSGPPSPERRDWHEQTATVIAAVVATLTVGSLVVSLVCLGH